MKNVINKNAKGQNNQFNSPIKYTRHMRLILIQQTSICARAFYYMSSKQTKICSNLQM